MLEFSILVALRKGIRTRILRAKYLFVFFLNLTLLTFLVLGHLEWLPE